MGSSYVSCSGTVLASFGAMLKYLGAMEAEILASAGNARCQGAGGRDQGFHNVILALGKMQKLGVGITGFRNPQSALVQTLGDGETYMDLMGRVLSQNGEVAYVVHQWDRRPEIKSIIDGTLFPLMTRVNLPPSYPKLRRSALEMAAQGHGGEFKAAAPVA